jgi:hypothetical protein
MADLTMTSGVALDQAQIIVHINVELCQDAPGSLYVLQLGINVKGDGDQ